MDGLSIVVPIYNEEKAVLPTIDQVNGIMQSSGIDYELLIVNDGSSDDTGKILKECGKSFTLIEHTRNMGYGAALKTGISKSKFNTIAITDADGTYPNERLPELYNTLIEEDLNMVVGKRSFKKLPMITKPAKWFITKLANYLAEFNIPDINSGLRVFRKKDAVRFFSIIPNGFSFTTTITLSMLTNNLAVKYIPIDYLKREGKSKIRPIYDTLNFMQLIIRTVMYFNPLKIFIPIFFVLIFVSLGVLLYSYFWLPRVLDVTTAIFFIAGIQMLAIGMIADLIDKRMKL